MREQIRSWIQVFVIFTWPAALTLYLTTSLQSRGNDHQTILMSAFGVLAILISWLLRGREGFKPSVKDFICCTGIYCLLLLGGLLLVLLGCALVGYLPYSDRPGPGWWTQPHLPIWEEIRFYIDWERLMIPMLFFWSTIFFAFAAIVGWLRTPRWIVRVCAGILCGLISFVATLAAGWYISLGAFPIYVAGGLGLLFGIFVLPRFAPHGATQWHTWARVVGATAAIFGFGMSVIYPILRTFSIQVR